MAAPKMKLKVRFGREGARKMRQALQEGKKPDDYILDLFRERLQNLVDERTWGQMLFEEALDYQARLLLAPLFAALLDGKAPRYLEFQIWDPERWGLRPAEEAIAELFGE